jgi:hypothetical protein
LSNAYLGNLAEGEADGAGAKEGGISCFAAMKRPQTQPGTQSEVRQSTQTRVLDELPDELLHLVVRILANCNQEKAVLRLRVASASLLERLRALLAALGAVPSNEKLWRLAQVNFALQFRRSPLRWLAATGCDLKQAAQRHTLRLVSGGMQDQGWATSVALPIVGSTSWSYTFSRSRKQGNTQPGLTRVGVCDVDGTCGWGVCMANGCIERWCRDEARRVRRARDIHHPPAGLPRTGEKSTLDIVRLPVRTASNVAIRCTLDAERGELLLQLNGQRPIVAVRGFPFGTRLRPWALIVAEDDEVHLSQLQWNGGRNFLDREYL